MVTRGLVFEIAEGVLASLGRRAAYAAGRAFGAQGLGRSASLLDVNE
jgi:hypothetical protein